MIATVHILDHGKDSVGGTISFKDGKMQSSNPDSLLLKNIIADKVFIGNKVYTAKDGEKFLKALPYQYTSPYLRVSVGNEEDQPKEKGFREELVKDMLGNLHPETDNLHNKYKIVNG